MPKKPRPKLQAEPTEDELDTLDLFLDSSEPHTGLPLDAVDGLLAAVACGPRLVMPSVWLPAIWEGQMPEFDSREEGQKILDILMKHYNSVVRAITAGSYAPIVTTHELDNGEEFDDPQDWCLGFQDGMMLEKDAWMTRLKADPRLQEILAPILAVADPDEEIRKAFESKEHREAILDDLCTAVIDLRDYWHERPLEN
jgi:uncharacterized protein